MTWSIPGCPSSATTDGIILGAPQMDGDKRRKQIEAILKAENVPVSGTELAKRAGVSRQVIVQDIALLRAENKEIMSTNKGYLMHKADTEGGRAHIRVLRVNHATKDTLDELQTIVDYGGRVLNVFIEHALYGQICVDLIINNRLDALEFVDQMKGTTDQPLKILTGGGHYHTVTADSEKNLDLIENELKKKGYLV